ncbi:MAG: signal peptidase II [Clostridia bacterium]|nr:signal peptidase II [Clostridia bacterium]
MKEKKKIKVPILLVLGAISAFVVALDRLTKFFAAADLSRIETFPIIENVLHLTYVENRGAAFGMLSDKRWVFMILSSAALVAIAVYAVINRRGSLLTNVSLALIFGGGIGNMIDRIATGYVVDFIDFRLINFYVFNVADSFVCIGSALLILSLILSEVKGRRKKKEETAG